jgi:hypothetical protein
MDKQPNPALVALGDIHLSDTIWRARPDISGDAILGLRNLVDTALSLKVPAVIVGDLFDTASQQDPRCLAGFMHEMDRMRGAGLEVWGIQGNHDKRPIPWYTLHPHVRHFGDGEPVQIGGLSCLGFDYNLQDGIRESLARLTQDITHMNLMGAPDVLFLHQFVKQSLQIEGAWNCDLEWIPPGIPVTVIGDIHQEQEFRFGNGQRAYYTGSGHPRSTAEFGPRSILVVNRDLTVWRHQVPTRPMWGGVWVSGRADEIERWLAESAPMAATSGLPPVLHLTFQREDSKVLTEWLQDLPREVLSVLVPVSQQSHVVASSQDTTLVTPEVLIKGFCQGREARQLALDLLGARQSLSDVITQHRTQFQKGT